MAHHFPDREEFKEQFFTLLKPEAGLYKVVLVYSLAISLLTLAVPLSVQLLVDTVANIALPRAVFLIASLLFALLFFLGRDVCLANLRNGIVFAEDLFANSKRDGDDCYARGVGLIWLIWRVWSWAAINSAFSLSQAKYDTASWLRSLAVTNESYRTTLHSTFAIEETDLLVSAHIDCQKRHFL